MDNRTIRQFQKMGVLAKKRLIQTYAKLGEDAVNYAFWKGYRSQPSRAHSRNTKFSFEEKKYVWSNRTGRLMDSMGSAVYLNGVLQKDTIYKLGGESSSNPKDDKDTRSGRQALEDYFNKIHPMEGRQDITLVIVAAMYYSKYLENGQHRGGYKIEVISAARDFVDRNYQSRLVDFYKRFRLPKPKAKVIKGDKEIRNA